MVVERRRRRRRRRRQKWVAIEPTTSLKARVKY